MQTNVMFTWDTFYVNFCLIVFKKFICAIRRYFLLMRSKHISQKQPFLSCLLICNQSRILDSPDTV